MPSRRATFFGSLAKLTGSGMPIRRAGELLLSHTRDAAVHEAVRALEQGLARGGTIAEALAPQLTPLERAMVRAAEAGGRLAEGFAHLENYHALRHATLARMKRAAVYPLLILHVAAATSGVVAFLGQAPPAEAVLRSLGLLWAVLGALAVLIVLAVRMAPRVTAADGLLRSLPVVRGVWSALAQARWYAVLHFHIAAGQKMSTALHDAAEAAASARLSAASRRMAAAAERGETVSETMRRASVFPGHAILGFASAEATGTLDVETAEQMRASMQQARTAADTAAEWLPRVLYIGALAYGAWHVFRLLEAILGQYSRALNGQW